MAIGLFIVATGLTLLTGNLRENRALLVESRLLQDLRTASDLVARDLRRAGYWADAGAGIRPAGGASPLANPYTAVTPSSVAANAVSFRFSRDDVENNSVDSNEQFGFRLRNGALELMLGNGNWQAITDTNTLLVSSFVVTPTVQTIALDAFCANPCGFSTSACPTQVVRSLGFSLTARAASDASVVRTVRQTVRLRNDGVDGACPP